MKLSNAALEALKRASSRNPPSVTPLRLGIQGIAATSLLASLRKAGYIDLNNCITDAGRIAVLESRVRTTKETLNQIYGKFAK